MNASSPAHYTAQRRRASRVWITIRPTSFRSDPRLHVGAGVRRPAARHGALVQRLQDHVRCIRFDIRGIGMSDALPNLRNSTTSVDDIIAVLDAVGIERAILLGAAFSASSAMSHSGSAIRARERADPFSDPNHAIPSADDLPIQTHGRVSSNGRAPR